MLIIRPLLRSAITPTQRHTDMRVRTASVVASIGLAAVFASCQPAGDSGSGITLDDDDIGGVVTSAAGPERAYGRPGRCWGPPELVSLG